MTASATEPGDSATQALIALAESEAAMRAAAAALLAECKARGATESDLAEFSRLLTAPLGAGASGQE